MTASEGPKLLSLWQAADAMAMTGASKARKAMRFLTEVEQRTDAKILMRVGGRGRGARYLVRLDEFMAYCPEFFGGVRREREDRGLDLVRERIERFDEQVAELHNRDRALAETLTREIAAISRRIDELEARMTRPALATR